jgi:2-keto-4-pentenoate hydratase/2-oxohepta-3-ene-1,7-dioic acid hydratase in catechol pathway
MPATQSPPAFALGTFSIAGSPTFAGVVMHERVLALHAIDSLRGSDSLLEVLDHWGQNKVALERAVADLDGARFTALSVPVSSIKVHAPLERPRQVFCSGANYRQHVIDLIVDQAREPAAQSMTREQRLDYATRLMDQRAANGVPYVFSRTWSSIAGPFDVLVLPNDIEQPDWELELAVVIGKPAYRVSRQDAYDYVAGYTICNDITNRELVHRQDLKALGSDWVMGKNLPGYMPMGPYVVPAMFVQTPQALRITLRLNGKVMQDESTADMIFDIPRLIEYLTNRVRLYPGDLLLTGSPSGNGSHFGRFLKPGDVMEGSIAGLGAQRTQCVGP